MTPKPFFTTKEKAEFSFARAVIAAGQGGLQGSLEAEMLADATRNAQKQFRPNQFFLPFELLMGNRALTAAGTGGTGSEFLTSQPALFALDALRPYSAPLRAGARMLSLPEGAAVPVVTAASTGNWLADENAQITPGQPTVGQVSLTSHEAGILTRISHKLSRQTDIDTFMRRELLRTVAGTLDLAILGGTGADGQPLGIVSTPDIGTVSGTSFDGDASAEMLEQVSTADDQPNLTWIGTPTVRKLLSRRPTFTGSAKAIWDDLLIDGWPAYASRVCPDGSLVLGDFQEVVVVLFADGVEVVVNPFSDEKQGLISYRAWLSADVALSTTGAFSVASSIT